MGILGDVGPVKRGGVLGTGYPRGTAGGCSARISSRCRGEQRREPQLRAGQALTARQIFRKAGIAQKEMQMFSGAKLER